jgi:predicted small secreted protein
MRNKIRLLLTLAALAAAAPVLAACNTTAGAGRDISAAGHDLTNSADHNK